jgi:hypothetical protein
MLIFHNRSPRSVRIFQAYNTVEEDAVVRGVRLAGMVDVVVGIEVVVVGSVDHLAVSHLVEGKSFSSKYHISSAKIFSATGAASVVGVVATTLTERSHDLRLEVLAWLDNSMGFH